MWFSFYPLYKRGDRGTESRVTGPGLQRSSDLRGKTPMATRGCGGLSAQGGGSQRLQRGRGGVGGAGAQNTGSCVPGSQCRQNSSHTIHIITDVINILLGLSRRPTRSTLPVLPWDPKKLTILHTQRKTLGGASQRPCVRPSIPPQWAPTKCPRPHQTAVLGPVLWQLGLVCFS